MKASIVLLMIVLFCACNDNENIVPVTNASSNSPNTSSYIVPQKSLSMLALGDSYTIGASVLKEDRWNEQLKVELEERNYKLNDIQYVARTGWTTRNLLNAIADENLLPKYDIVTLLIGVNNQYQRIDIEVFEEEYEELLNLAIQYAGNDPSKVIVLSIPDYGYTYSVPSQSISQEINQYNNLKQSITNRNQVVFHNITSYTRQVQNNPSLVASDGLHPSGNLYKLWVDDIINKVYEQFLVPAN
ncbi:SGNH/GDSL hydrolase family protein [Flammeovirga agarivorans]|uniref:SGNH/GDSL hydrolase family protein n=1 Tax=Flammeovirga agarivorans TaxID=2726742 RepID=A0A7X8SIP1_9BACT|nr:GDSL-type esterase/lipase family protein [Flammeovirga agarivorans]NLR90969.1 SGNH/GDSL hydrolase family protein [Flammeovirga agarivorans]